MDTTEGNVAGVGTVAGGGKVTIDASMTRASAEEPPAKRARSDEDATGANNIPASTEPPAAAAGPPKFSEEDYVKADDGWWLHKGGSQWMFNVEERTYFHLPTGQLQLAADSAAGSDLAVLASDSGTAVTNGNGSGNKVLALAGSAKEIAAALPQRGRVRWFNSAKGFGFLSPEDGSPDIFVHRNQILEDEHSDIFASLRKGARVTYALGETDDGRPCAVAVQLGDWSGFDDKGDEEADCGQEEVEEEIDDDDDASSIDIDLEEELKSGSFLEKGVGKDTIEDFAVQKAKLPISVLGETATCLFFGVFDGHGGHSCAEYAYNHLAKNVMSRLRDRTKSASDEAALKTALLGGFKQTEHNFLQHARRVSDNSGSTACTMTVFGPDEQMRLRLFLANAGDSRAVLGKVNGAAVRLTEDHKPNLLREKKRIELEGGSVAEVQGVWRCILPAKKRLLSKIVGLAVSRGFGDKDFKQPDIVSAEPEISIHEVDWEADYFVILASDGIWDVMSDKEAVRLVHGCLRKGDSEEKAAEALVKRAGEKGSPDDRTAVVVRFGWLKASGEVAIMAEEDEDDEEKLAVCAKAAIARAAMEGAVRNAHGGAEEEDEEEENDDDDDDDEDEAAMAAAQPQELDAEALAALDAWQPTNQATTPAPAANRTDDDIFAGVERLRGERMDEDKADLLASFSAAAAPASATVSAVAVAGGVDRAGLFDGLGPTQEELAETVGPSRPPPVAAALAATHAKDSVQKEAEASQVSAQPAVDEDLDMFG